MSKYTLELTDKNPANNMTIHRKDSKEAVEYKRKAQKMGFKVRVKGVKNEQNTLTAKEQQA